MTEKDSRGHIALSLSASTSKVTMGPSSISTSLAAVVRFSRRSQSGQLCSLRLALAWRRLSYRLQFNPLHYPATMTSRPYTKGELYILQKKDLRNLIGAQKDRWPSDIAFNDKTKKQVLIQELLRPSNRFTTTVPIVTFDPAHGVRQTTPSKGNTENTLVPPPSRSQGNTTEDGTSNAQTAARQSNEGSSNLRATASAAQTQSLIDKDNLHTVLILLRDRQKKRENVLQGVAVGAQSLIMGDEGQPARMEMDVVDIVSALQKTKAVPEEYSCDFWIDVEISGIADGPVQQHIASIEQDGNVTRPNWAPKCLVVVEGIILQITIDIRLPMAHRDQNSATDNIPEYNSTMHGGYLNYVNETMPLRQQKTSAARKQLKNDRRSNRDRDRAPMRDELSTKLAEITGYETFIENRNLQLSNKDAAVAWAFVHECITQWRRKKVGPIHSQFSVTNEDIAAALHVSQSTITNYEAGHRLLSRYGIRSEMPESEVLQMMDSDKAEDNQGATQFLEFLRKIKKSKGDLDVQAKGKRKSRSKPESESESES